MLITAAAAEHERAEKAKFRRTLDGKKKVDGRYTRYGERRLFPPTEYIIGP